MLQLLVGMPRSEHKPRTRDVAVPVAYTVLATQCRPSPANARAPGKVLTGTRVGAVSAFRADVCCQTLARHPADYALADSPITSMAAMTNASSAGHNQRMNRVWYRNLVLRLG
jgi:hypothetical protein